MRARRGRAAGVLLACAVLCAATASAALDLDAQLQEIRTLVREKRYPLALESLRLVARQIQDLRLEAVAPAFPEPLDGWGAAAPLSLLEEEEIWTDRIAAQRAYTLPDGSARMDLVIDVHSPFAAQAALGSNPLILAADPQARAVQIAGHPGRVRFNPDTREGELRVVLGRDTLITVRGRGLPDEQSLVRLAERINAAHLRSISGL